MGPEWIVVGVIAVAVLFGAKKIPEMARSVGRAQGEFKRGIREGAVDETGDAQSSTQAQPGAQPPQPAPPASQPPATAPPPATGTPQTATPPQQTPSDQPPQTGSQT